MLPPRHNRHRADAVLRAAFDHPVAVGKANRHIALAVEKTKGRRLLKSLVFLSVKQKTGEYQLDESKHLETE
jgi:hypothetical protein